MAVYQISKIQIRRGKANSGVEFPQLASGELGWAIDTQELFIGNGSVSEGAPLVGNTKILTTRDEILSTAEYSYRITTPSFTTGISSNTPIFRLLQSRLDDRVNVSDFGAIGNGIVDDTAAIIRAVTNLFANITNPASTTPTNRLILEFPAGIYRITDTITIPSFANIVGHGIDKTIIQFNSDHGDKIAFRTVADTSTLSTTTQPRKIKIADLTITTNSSTTACVDLSNTCNSEFYNLKISGSIIGLVNNIGILLNAESTTITASNNIFKNVSVNKFYYGIFNNQYSNNNIFDIMSISNATYGMVFGNSNASNQNEFNNFKFSTIANYGLNIKNGTQNRISNCYISAVGTNTPQIYFTTFGNECRNITSDRSATSLAGSAGTQYYPEVAGVFSYTSNKFTVTRSADGSLFRLPLNSSVDGGTITPVTYTINYVYNSTNLIRQGILTILTAVVNDSMTASIDDEYTGLGNALSSWEQYLKLSFSASIANNSIIVSSTNTLSADTSGSFTYSFTATSTATS